MFAVNQGYAAGCWENDSYYFHRETKIYVSKLSDCPHFLCCLLGFSLNIQQSMALVFARSDVINFNINIRNILCFMNNALSVANKSNILVETTHFLGLTILSRLLEVFLRTLIIYILECLRGYQTK